MGHVFNNLKNSEFVKLWTPRISNKVTVPQGIPQWLSW